MWRSLRIIALTSLIALLALPAVAADNGFYIGGSAGQASIDVTEDGVEEFSGDDMSYKVFAGFRFITFLGVEASYIDFGTPDDEIEGVSLEADVSGIDAFAVGYLPLGIADIFVKAGMIDWDADIKATLDNDSEVFSDDGTDPAYGVGFQFRFSSFTLRGEVEYFDIETADNVYMYSVGGAFTF